MIPSVLIFISIDTDRKNEKYLKPNFFLVLICVFLIPFFVLQKSMFFDAKLILVLYYKMNKIKVI